MKKILLLLLAALLVLVSCEKEPVSENNETIDTEYENDIITERAGISDGLGEFNFGERELRVVSNAPSEFFTEEEERNKGNLIYDAIFERNERVEQRFNFKIKVVYTSGINEVADWVTKTVMSGADEFDLLINHTMITAGTVLKNLYLNWYDIPYVDFSKPWWASANTDTLTYDGKCILAVSDLNLSAINQTYALYFNKALANTWDVGDLYGMALRGEWTFDKFAGIVKDIYTDLDGDGEKSRGDFYGATQADHSNVNQWLWAFDNPTVSKNEEGIPVVSVKTDKINNIINELYDYCFNTQGVWFEVNRENPNAGSNVTDMFIGKKTIFHIGSLNAATSESFRNFEDDYGILPMPKWDANQQSYTNMTYGGHSVLAVPKTCPDTELVGVAVEALSAESYKTVVPTFYEIALKTRYLRDSESKEVLDLIINSRIFDFGYIYDGWQGFGWTIHNMFFEGSKNFESYYASRYPSAKIHYKKIVKIFDKL